MRDDVQNNKLYNEQCARSHTGNYSCIYAKFLLNRQFHYYLVQTYVPTILIVILSWVSFWIDETAVPARITLGILTVLTMTSQSTIINQRLPRVSYIKVGVHPTQMCTCLLHKGGRVSYIQLGVSPTYRWVYILHKCGHVSCIKVGVCPIYNWACLQHIGGHASYIKNVGVLLT